MKRWADLLFLLDIQKVYIPHLPLLKCLGALLYHGYATCDRASRYSLHDWHGDWRERVGTVDALPWFSRAGATIMSSILCHTCCHWPSMDMSLDKWCDIVDIWRRTKFSEFSAASNCDMKPFTKTDMLKTCCRIWSYIDPDPYSANVGGSTNVLDDTFPTFKGSAANRVCNASMNAGGLIILISTYPCPGIEVRVTYFVSLRAWHWFLFQRSTMATTYLSFPLFTFRISAYMHTHA